MIWALYSPPTAPPCPMHEPQKSSSVQSQLVHLSRSNATTNFNNVERLLDILSSGEVMIKSKNTPQSIISDEEPLRVPETPKLIQIAKEIEALIVVSRLYFIFSNEPTEIVDDYPNGPL